MIRLSVTDLDSYLYWKESEDMEFEELLVRLRGEEPPKRPMLAGKAFHSMLEHANLGELDWAEVDGWRFDFALNATLALPPVRELKAEHVFQTSSGPVTLVGKVDSLDGLTVHDYKLTERFDVERYTDSYQWRSYLTMFGARRFVYDVFVGRYDDIDQKVWIFDYQRLPLEAYPSMRSDVQRVVDGLAEIVAKHVPQKIVEAS